MARIFLHPDGLAPRIANLGGFAAQLLRHMHHTLASRHDEVLATVIEECGALVPRPTRSAEAPDDSVVLHPLGAGRSTVVVGVHHLGLVKPRRGRQDSTHVGRTHHRCLSHPRGALTQLHPRHLGRTVLEALGERV